jgi:hypothetical protein
MLALAMLPLAGWAATEPTAQAAFVYYPTGGSSANTPSAVIKLSGTTAGTRYLVVVRRSAVAAVAPIDGRTYVASAAYGAAGSTTGFNSTTNTNTDNGNYVVFAGTAPADGKVTVTGLTYTTPANSGYVVDVYAYNQDGSAPITNYLTSSVPSRAFTALPTYTWTAATTTAEADFGAATNWAPNRATNAVTVNDVVVFDGSTRATASVQISKGYDNQNQQQIGGLYIVNNAAVTMFAPGTANQAGILELSNAGTGDDFTLGAGSSLTLTTGSNTDNRHTIIRLLTGATAGISGTMNNAVAGSLIVPNRFVAASAGAIRFLDGSTFNSLDVAGYPFSTTGTGETTSALGWAGAGSVVFESGSTFAQASGQHPFGDGATGVASFLSGSTYRYSGGSMSEAARQYGNLDFRATYLTSGAFATTILNNLTVTGSATVGPAAVLNNTGGVTIGGNIGVNPGTFGFTTLEFSPASAANVTLNGTSSVQTIGGTGSVTFGANATLVLNNPLGVSLLMPITLPKALTFGAQSGKLFTTEANLLTMPTSAVVSGFGTSSYVQGAMARVTAGGGPSTVAGGTGLFFPVGTDNSYGPVSLTLTQAAGSGPATYTVRPIASRAPGYNVPDAVTDIKRVSGIRYYNLTTNGSFTNGQIALGFFPIDQVDAPSTLRVAQGVNGNWLNIGGVVTPVQPDGTTFLTGTVTSNATLSSLGDFVLATTSLANTPGNNPLPVELTAFTAARQGSGVLLKWTTAQEKNNARFEVERSADGLKFQTIGKVAGKGTTTAASAYAFTDATPLGGVNYYRLRQVDTDESYRYSQVVAVTAAEALLRAAYPNPAQQELHVVVGAEPVQWRLLNLLGQPLREGKAQAQTTLDLSGLPAGSYQLEVRSGSQRVVRSITKIN